MVNLLMAMKESTMGAMDNVQTESVWETVGPKATHLMIVQAMTLPFS